MRLISSCTRSTSVYGGAGASISERMLSCGRPAYGSTFPSSARGPAEFTSTRPPMPSADPSPAANMAEYPPREFPAKMTCLLKEAGRITSLMKSQICAAQTCPPHTLNPVGTSGCSEKPNPRRSMAYTGLSAASCSTLSLQCSIDAPKPWMSRMGFFFPSGLTLAYLTLIVFHCQNWPSLHFCTGCVVVTVVAPSTDVSAGFADI
mmetsp:Transcript_34030/g.106608  ORF Transcript_34030/g.106608 Transcript_34030/m.106608 type:complete len:205 (+) Transcript_34030:1695-2309(+)